MINNIHIHPVELISKRKHNICIPHKPQKLYRHKHIYSRRPHQPYKCNTVSAILDIHHEEHSNKTKTHKDKNTYDPSPIRRAYKQTYSNYHTDLEAQTIWQKQTCIYHLTHRNNTDINTCTTSRPVSHTKDMWIDRHWVPTPTLIPRPCKFIGIWSGRNEWGLALLIDRATIGGSQSGSCAIIGYYPIQFRLIFCLLSYCYFIILLLARCFVFVVFVVIRVIVLICHPYIILLLLVLLWQKHHVQENIKS